MSLQVSSRMKRRLLKGTGIALLVSVIAIVLLSLWIELTVQRVCEKALREHPGDRVQALIACVDSREYSYHERNRAIWALGQLGDRRALPSLKDHLTGQPCDHERDGFCQGELKDAIQKLEGGRFNLPAVLWRGVVMR